MIKFLIAAPLISIAGLVLLAACGGSSSTATATLATATVEPAPAATTTAVPGDPTATSGILPVSLTLQNHGGDMEGNTPRGFKGMGTSLFVGDNLNRNFPDGDGVQIFLTFDLGRLPKGTVQSAVLRSVRPAISGTPFEDLGELTAEEIRYDGFSSGLWGLAPVAGGARCILAESAAGPFQCDISAAIQRSLDDSYRYAQFRLRMDQAGDGDGRQDLVAFFKRDSNTNEPGIFVLDVTVLPD